MLFLVLDVPNIGNTSFFYVMEMAIVTKIFASSAVLLFCILCKILAGRINSIRQQILVQQTSDFVVTNKDFTLRKLRSRYTCVSHSVELLNDCFGYIMMFEIPFIFVGVINTSMDLVISAHLGDWGSKVFSIVFFFNHIINLIIICLSSEKIHTEVI